MFLLWEKWIWDVVLKNDKKRKRNEMHSFFKKLKRKVSSIYNQVFDWSWRITKTNKFFFKKGRRAAVYCGFI